MNVQLPVHMDKAAFLDWVEGREERYELDRGRVVMMTGGSRAHWQITVNLLMALDTRLDPDSGLFFLNSGRTRSPFASPMSWLMPPIKRQRI